jgi:hypothetical protein
LEDEVARLCGARYQHQPDRAHTPYGRQGGVVTLAGQKLPIDRPRVRRTDGGGEVPLGTYTRLQSPDGRSRSTQWPPGPPLWAHPSPRRAVAVSEAPSHS